jgi:hypothetical protein
MLLHTILRLVSFGRKYNNLFLLKNNLFNKSLQHSNKPKSLISLHAPHVGGASEPQPTNQEEKIYIYFIDEITINTLLSPDYSYIFPFEIEVRKRNDTVQV